MLLKFINIQKYKWKVINKQNNQKKKFHTDQKMAENTLANKIKGKAKSADACKFTVFIKPPN